VAGPAIRMDWPKEAAGVAAWPVTAGLPLAKDARVDLAAMRVTTRAGAAVPAQWRVLQKWPSGGPRWVSIEFLAERGAGDYRVGFLGGTGQAASGIEVTEDGGAITVDTAALRVEIPKRGGCGLFRRVWVDGRVVSENGADAGVYMVDQNGEKYFASRDNANYRVRVERRGAIHTVVRIDGDYVSARGARKCGYTSRLHFYADQPFMRLQHTFLFTENSDDLQVRDLGARVDMARTVRPTAATFDASSAAGPRSRRVPLSPAVESAWLLQDVYHHLLQPKSHWGLYVKNKGRAEREILSGKRAGNWVSLAGNDAAMTVTLRNLWQEFPKELEVRGRSVVVHLWSSRRGKPLDFRVPAVLEFWGKENLALAGKRRSWSLKAMKQGKYPNNAKGLAKTHEILFHFHKPTAAAAATADAFSRPPLAYPGPAWTAATDVVGPLSPYDPKRFPEIEKKLDLIVDTGARMVREWGDYGWWEHGSGPHLNYYVIEKKPWAQLKRYTGGCEYWYSRAMWIGYLRSGKRKYFDLTADRARHFMDVVICHQDSDTRWRGDFYWTPGESPIHWGGGKRIQMTRMKTAGVHAQFGFTIDMLLQYYYLTGDDRAWDVVEEYADLYRRLLGQNPEWVNETWRQANIMWSRKVFATLDELSILYEATLDPFFAREARRLADQAFVPDLPGGIHREPQFRGGKKDYPKPYAIYYKTPCVWRYWRATGDPRGLRTLLKMQQYDYETGGASRYAGLRYYYAWQHGKPVSYVAYAEYLARLELKSRFNIWPADSPYPINLGGLTLATASDILSWNAIMAARRTLGRALPAVPALIRHPEAPAGAILIKKGPGQEGRLEIVTTGPELRLTPRGGAKVATRTYYGAAFHEVTLPADVRESVFRVALDAREGARVLTATGVRLMLAAPGGLAVDAEPDGARWHFRLDPDARSFVAECADPGMVALVSPIGRKVALGAGKKRGLRTTVPVRAGEDRDAWTIEPKERTFLKITGATPVFAFRDKDQLFPAGDAVKPPAPEVASTGERYPAGVSGRALRLAADEYLSIPTGRKISPLRRERLNLGEGTIEMWVRPTWSYFMTPAGVHRPLLYVPDEKGDGPTFNVYYMKVKKTRGTMAYDIRGYFGGATASVANWGRRQARWMAGEWVHLAIEWQAKGKTRSLWYYVNGKRDGNKGQWMYWKRLPGFAPRPAGAEMLIGGGGDPRRALHFDATIDELRISRTRRYHTTDAFTPPKDLKADAETLALFKFDGDLEAQGGKGAGAAIKKTKTRK